MSMTMKGSLKNTPAFSQTEALAYAMNTPAKKLLWNKPAISITIGKGQLWNDGATGEFSVKNRKQAEVMVIQLLLRTGSTKGDTDKGLTFGKR